MSSSGFLAGALGPLGHRIPGVVDVPPPHADDDPDRAWARSGAMALTADGDRRLLAPPATTRRILDLGRSIDGLSALHGRRVDVDPLGRLCERAALEGLTAGGITSCGRHTRLLECADGRLALSLAREADRDAVGAWLERGAVGWEALSAAVRGRPCALLVARGRLLELPIAALDEVPPPAPPVVARRLGDTPAAAPPLDDALVVNLAALWAGPLAADLLRQAGARVVKVESTGRPDGARAGQPAFFARLHGGHESVALDFSSADGREQLRRLVMAADVVIEGSRPRALRQLGLRAEEVLVRGRAQVWLSITAHGWHGERGAWTGFGDDAAIAGGLAGRGEHGAPRFCADAVADPLTGMAAAAAVLAAYGAGRWHLDVALSRVAAAVAGPEARHPWRADRAAAADLPAAPDTGAPVRPLGADTDAVLRDVAARSPR